MNTTNRTTILLLIALLGTTVLCSPSRAEAPARANETTWLAAVDEEIGAADAPAAEPVETSGWKKPIPIGFYLDCTVATDCRYRWPLLITDY